ncbi:hypothetical protein VNO77_23529 [Canavalia gladiata]|uniref:Uncharacterized protein n=1 Tax=Canavalia gladiata TaxID=3824 RepID=A0AAN9L4L5_CANGL
MGPKFLSNVFALIRLKHMTDLNYEAEAEESNNACQCIFGSQKQSLAGSNYSSHGPNIIHSISFACFDVPTEVDENWKFFVSGKALF